MSESHFCLLSQYFPLSGKKGPNSPSSTAWLILHAFPSSPNPVCLGVIELLSILLLLEPVMQFPNWNSSFREPRAQMLLNLHLGNRFATKSEYWGTRSMFQTLYKEFHSSRSHPVSSLMEDRWSNLRMIRKFQKHDIMCISLKTFLFGLASEKQSLCPSHSLSVFGKFS